MVSETRQPDLINNLTSYILTKHLTDYATDPPDVTILLTHHLTMLLTHPLTLLLTYHMTKLVTHHLTMLTYPPPDHATD